MILSGKYVYPTILLLHYMKALSNSKKLKAFIYTKMTYLIIFLDNNRKLAVYTGGNIHELYCYLEMIGSPTKLTTSGQRSNHFGPSSSTNNDTANIKTIIAAQRIIQKGICEYCGRIGHKAVACIIRGPKMLPSIIIRKMNQFKAILGHEPIYPPREWNIQPPAAHFKYRTFPTTTSSVVSSSMERFNYHAIDNGDVEVQPSKFPV